MRRIRPALFFILVGGCSGASRPTTEDLVSALRSFVGRAEVAATEGGARIEDPDDSIVRALRSLSRSGENRHLPYLLEYGLKFHAACLEYSHLARELPVSHNILFAELVRVAGIRKYQTPHEAGWLASQFYGPFNWSGWSSYQIYRWAKEHEAFDGFPNEDRIRLLLAKIDASPACKIGGDNVCHYGCR